MVLRKFSRYYSHYGIRATVQLGLRTAQKKLGMKRSTTVFLRWRAQEGRVHQVAPSAPQFHFRPLGEADLTAFERIKFYDFVVTREWLVQGSQAILACDADQIMGYGWIHTRPQHHLPGLGTFKLEPGEAWLGPDFVGVAFRGRGIHNQLVAARVRCTQDQGFHTLFTAVNLDNTSSLANFERHGFQRIGTWSVRRLLERVLPSEPRDFTRDQTLTGRMLTNPPL